MDDASHRRKSPGNPDLKDAADDVNRQLNRKVGLARLALLWERAWPLVLPPAALTGGFLALGLFGLWHDLPPIAHLTALVMVAIAIGLSLTPLFKLRWPSRSQGLDRLDAHSGFLHRPAEGYDDKLAGTPDAAQKAIWHAHRQRLLAKVRAMPVAAPKPRLWEHDPFALRAVVALALVIGLAYSGPDWWSRISGAVTPGAIAASPPARLDGWITPPAYTAKPPVFIADGGRMLAEIGTPDAPVRVPENSELVLRLHHGEDVKLVLHSANGEEIPFDIAPAATDKNAASSGKSKATETRLLKTQELRHVFGGGSRLTLNAAGTSLEWRFELVRDTPPTISLERNTDITGDEALKIIYAARDDYGVVSARAEFRVIETDEPRQLGEDISGGIEPGGPRLEISAPDFDLLLPGNRLRDVTRTTYKDLTAHPWAGLEVEITLIAVDEAGQVGKSPPQPMLLPQRQFREPVARALIEQRRNLVAMPSRRNRVAKSLGALTLAPEHFIEDTGVFLGLRHAYHLTRKISTSEHLGEVVSLLWDIALHIEDGDLSLAERELRAAQDALERALAEGAPPEEIDRLLQEMRDALGRFMAAMREEATREAARQQQQQPGANQRLLQSQDIDRLMDMIAQMSRSGANEAAQKLLEQLRNILENLEGARAQGPISPELNQMSETLDELSRMLAEQQRLMDETFRQNGTESQQGQRGETDRQGERQSEQGQTGRERSLAERQEALRQQLRQLMDKMANDGLKVPGQLPHAGENMGAAENRLSQGEPGQALGPQGSAIESLRQGARSMAQQMMDGMAARQGRNQRGQTRADGRTDPLGRPRPATGPDFGLSVKIPDKIDAETARELREELQRRLGDRTRRPLERNYLERLLKRF